MRPHHLVHPVFVNPTLIMRMLQSRTVPTHIPPIILVAPPHLYSHVDVVDLLSLTEITAEQAHALDAIREIVIIVDPPDPLEKSVKRTRCRFPFHGGRCRSLR